MPSTAYLMLRSAQRARLEARTMLIQHSHPLVEFVEQRLCVFEIRRVEAFGEPSVDRREKVAGFGGAALVAAEPGEARSGAQFPELGLLLLGDAQGFAIQYLGGLRLPLTRQQLAFVPVQLCRQLALP